MSKNLYQEDDINDLVAEDMVATMNEANKRVADAKDAKIRENDKKIADHPVKTSKNSPTGG